MRRGYSRGIFWGTGLVSSLLVAGIAGAVGYSLRHGDHTAAQAKFDQRIDVLETKIDSIIASVSTPLAKVRAVPEMRQGWHVRVFEPPRPASNLENIRQSHDAGSFIHTGSWMDLEEHREHEGIFLAADAAFNVRGMFIPTMTGDYVFAVHMLYSRRENADRPTAVICHVDVKVADQASVVAGKMMAYGKVEKAALLAPATVFLPAGQPQLVDAVIACDVPKDVAGKNVAIRICVRHKNDQSYRPVLAYLPAT